MLDTVNRIKFFLVGILLLSSFFIGYGQLPSELPSQVSVVEPVVDTLVTPTDTLTAIPEQDEEDLAQEIVYPPIGIYGHDFLRQSSFARYSNQDQNRISDEYVLGPGDELVVSIWDEDAAISELLVISEEGFVQGAKIGRLNLAGVQFGNAEEIVKAKYSAFFNFNTSNFDLAISQAKTIMVDIVGEVEVPGTHQVSALNRLINVIMLSGGPTINGSVREIVVKRDGRVHKVMDLYEYLNNTDAGVGNIYLANNDVILIPPIGPVVRVDGPVRKPTSFELKERETFSDLLGFAGGFEPQAVKNAYQVLRYGDDDYFITDFSYNKDSKVGEEPLINGDLVQIKRISAQAENFVRAEGSFNLPGTYEYTENMRVSDLVKKSGNLKYDALSNRAFIRRKNDRLETVNIPINLAEILENVGSDSDILLYPRDIVTVFSKNRITETYSVEIFGEVKAPGTYNFSNELTIEDLILLAGGFSPSALNNEVELSRVIDYQQESGQLIPIRGAREKVAIDFSAFEDSESASQTKLTPYDQIFVRKVPEFELPKTISIEGEVVYPGAYPLGSKDMRVKDLIEQAGGLTPYAFAEG
nr:SLBB domain-containing protein [Saprospiraceae bacterium]